MVVRVCVVVIDSIVVAGIIQKDASPVVRVYGVVFNNIMRGES